MLDLRFVVFDKKANETCTKRSFDDLYNSSYMFYHENRTRDYPSTGLKTFYKQSCAKQFLLSEAGVNKSTWTLNRESLVGDANALWQSRREYKVNFNTLKLSDDIYDKLDSFDPSYNAMGKNQFGDLSFFGVQVLVDQSYWETSKKRMDNL